MAGVARPWLWHGCLENYMMGQRHTHSKVLQDWESKGGLARELSLEEATDLAQRVGAEFMSTDEKTKIQSSNLAGAGGGYQYPCWPSGLYRCIVADPPWDISRGPMGKKNQDGTWCQKTHKLPYALMTIDEISSMPVCDIADNDAHLYLWTVNRYVEQSYAVARAWGFRPAYLLTWAKTPKKWNIGGIYASTTEHILFARRGKLKALSREMSTWWNWNRGKHSAKPEAFQDIVETVSPGPRIELFARRHRPGWTVWGNEIEDLN